MIVVRSDGQTVNYHYSTSSTLFHISALINDMVMINFIQNAQNSRQVFFRPTINFAIYLRSDKSINGCIIMTSSYLRHLSSPALRNDGIRTGDLTVVSLMFNQLGPFAGGHAKQANAITIETFETIQN